MWILHAATLNLNTFLFDIWTNFNKFIWDIPDVAGLVLIDFDVAMARNFWQTNISRKWKIPSKQTRKISFAAVFFIAFYLIVEIFYLFFLI